METADREILDNFIRTRNKTVQLLARVPDDWLVRQADGEDRPLGALFMHIADGVNWWMHHAMGDGRGWSYPGDGPFGRSELIDALNASEDRLVVFFEADHTRMADVFALPPDKREGDGQWIGRNRVLYLTDHEVHHRAKIALALRQWGFADFPFMPF